MKMKKSIVAICLGALAWGTLTGCFAGKSTASSGRGGEVTGVGGGRPFREPAPLRHDTCQTWLVENGFGKTGLPMG